MLKKIFRLHSYIKKNYENGNFQVNENYSDSHNYQNTFKNSISDFNLGKRAALKDFTANHKFKLYPVKIISMVNSLFKNKFHEIADFVTGYDQSKREILDKSKHI